LIDITLVVVIVIALLTVYRIHATGPDVTIAR